MKNKPYLLFVSASLFTAILVMSCQLFSGPAGSGAPPPTQLPGLRATAVQAVPTEASAGQSSPLPPATQTAPSPAESPAPPSAPAADKLRCEQGSCVDAGTFLLMRPVGQGGRVEIDPSDRFGEYQRSTRSANLGVDFLNSTGTPVIAAADGKVVAAGDDSRTAYGQRRNMYGNLVILEHNLLGIPVPVYTLYAHLSEVLVKEGDYATAGQEIGRVGMSGDVSGSTLHFEVREGENSPDAVRNPELWLEPLADEEGQAMGALAGRLVDANGDYLSIDNIVLEELAGPGQPALDQVYIQTYTDKDMVGRSPWGENFAAGDLPAGEYQVSVWMNEMHQQTVEVQPGMLTVMTLQVK